MRTRAAAIGLAVAVIVGLGPSAEAYHYLSCKQPDLNVVAKNDSSTTGGADSYANQWNGALNDWNATTSETRFYSPSGSSFDIRLNNWNEPTKSYSGYAYITCFGATMGVPFNVTINDFKTNLYTASAKRSVMSHELGHALGLAHAGSISNCSIVPIMYENDDRWNVCSRKTPNTDDVNGVNARYP